MPFPLPRRTASCGAALALATGLALAQQEPAADPGPVLKQVVLRPDRAELSLWTEHDVPAGLSLVVAGDAPRDGASRVFAWRRARVVEIRREPIGDDRERVLALVEAEVGGPTPIALTWTDRSATSRLMYRVGVDRAAGRCTLELEALVSQRSGAAWSAEWLTVTPDSALAPRRMPSYAASSRVEIPGDGRTVTVPLLRLDHSARIEHHVSGWAEVAAYAEAVTRAPITHVLPAAEALVVLDGVEAGRVALPETAAGGELRIPLGPEPRIAVQREGVSRTVRPRSVVEDVRTTLTSSFDEPVVVTLQERLPPPPAPNLRPRIFGGTTPRWTRGDDGLVSWTLTLRPRVPQAVAWLVLHPPDHRPVACGNAD